MQSFFRITTGILCSLLLFCTHADYGASSQGNAGSIDTALLNVEVPTIPDRSSREELHQLFINEIGVRESGVDNSGERVEEYLAVTGLGPGFAWCAAFVSWGYNQCGIDTPESAWSPDWFPNENTIYTRGDKEFKGEESDVIGIWFQSKGRIAHVGVIDVVSNSYVITIEGNTNDAGSREGDRVQRKKRVKRQIYKVSSWLKD